MFANKLSPLVQGATSDSLMQQSPQVLQCHLKDKGVHFYGRISQGQETQLGTPKMINELMTL